MNDSTVQSDAVSQDEARTAFILTSLYAFSRLSPPRFMPGNILLGICAASMKEGRRFENDSEFRAFMAGLIDSGMVMERTGRTMIAEDLEDLQFSLSKVIHALLKIAGAKVGGA